MLRRSQIPGVSLQMVVMGLCVLSGFPMPASNAQSPAVLKAFATQPHVGPVEQALVGVETRTVSSAGSALVRHGNGVMIRSDGFVLTSAALFSKPLLSPKYAVAVILHPGMPNEVRLTASIVMHEGMVRRLFVGRPEPYVVLKIANLHSPALRLLLPDPLMSEHQVTLAWSLWDETSKHFKPVQQRTVELAPIKRQAAPLNRLAFAHAEDVVSTGAVIIGPDGMGVGLISDAFKAAASSSSSSSIASTAFSTFATLNTLTNCISPQSVTDARFATLYRTGAENGSEAAQEGTAPAVPPKLQAGKIAEDKKKSEASKKTDSNNKTEADLVPPNDASPADLQSQLEKSAGMVAVPGGAMLLPPVLRLYQTDMTGAHTACVAPFLIDKYEVTNAQYYQFWQSLTPQEQKLNGEAYYPVGWAPRNPPFPSDMGDIPVLGVRLVGAQAYATWAGKRLPTPYEWCLAAFGPSGGNEMPEWVKRYVADKQATWQKIVQAHAAYTEQFPIVRQNGANLDVFLPWLFCYPFEANSVNFSYNTVMEAVTHLWRDWIDPQHVLPGGSRPFDISPYGAYDMILNADELIMPYQAYRNREFTPEDGTIKELYMQVSFPGPQNQERSQVSGPYGPDAIISWTGPGDLFLGYREPMLSRRLRGPANYPWQDASYLDFLQAHARIKEVSDMMYTAQAVICLEPGPTIVAPDTFSVFTPPQPVREDDAGSMRVRYKDLIPRTLSGPIRTDFHQSQWYSAWRNVAVPTHREMGRVAEMSSSVPYNSNLEANPWALYLVPGGFRCVR